MKRVGLFIFVSVYILQSILSYAQAQAYCAHGRYRYTGSSPDSCRWVTELNVRDILFSNVSTTEFYVSWIPSTRSLVHISGYDIEWQSGKVEDASSPQKVTGLTPGKVYEIKVLAKDTATEPGVTRRTSISKQQATKPSIPGNVRSSGNDLDALDGNVTIKWIEGAGEATNYRVKLLDGDKQKDSKETSSSFTIFSNVLNGHRYSIVITARSEQFDDKFIWSDEKVSSIKTNVQVPDAPRNGVCQSPTDSTITLDWEAPTLPNGDLVRYHVDVMDTNNKVLYRNKTTGTETEKVFEYLQPGTSYVFRLYTENEKYISSSYDHVLSSCKTSAKMSDPPTKIAITNVTSRGFDISWEKPKETYSEENYGYVLQIKDDKDSCWKEVIYRCSDCKGRLTLSDLTDLCEPKNRGEVVDKKEKELATKLMYSASLLPGIAYTVSVTAINDAGRGHAASMTQTTFEQCVHATDECYCSTQSAVTGTVLGLTNLILFVYAGYATIIIRRIRAKGGQEKNSCNRIGHVSETYVNEEFSVAVPGASNQTNVQNPGRDAELPDSEYSTLENSLRDGTTYDRLRPGH